jgi:lipoate-protein ligase A
MKSDVETVHVSIFTALDVYHDFTLRSAATNMAIDEALLETANVPSIRFYRWNSPALSFGYFGKFADVADYAGERDLVRRWTGGGIVFHGDDLTYSIIIPANEPAFGESPKLTYEKIHCALRDALAANGGRVELAALARDAASRRPRTAQRAVPANVCFANPVRADVMVNGRKVAGAAQRHTRAGLLHQGSIQLATGRVRVAAATGDVDLGNGLAKRFATELSDVRNEKSLSKSLVERAEKIAEQKYNTQNWLQRR